MVQGNLELENVRLIFRNFSGKQTKYNRAGARNFCVVIDDPEVAQNLANDGWNIKVLRPRDEDDTPTHYLTVAVSFDNFPPNVFMVTRNNKVRLDEDSIDTLDDADIKSADLIIRPYNWEIQDRDGVKSGVKAYLKTGYICIEEDAFADKYRRGPEISDDEMPFN